MAFLNPPWERVTRHGIPTLVLVRAIPGSQLAVGNEYPIPDSTDKRVVMRARQLYEQRRLAPAEPKPGAGAKFKTKEVNSGNRKK